MHRVQEIYTQLYIETFKKLYILGSQRSSTSNSSGLEEYVDILQVQQLLLDSSTTNGISTTTSRSRPKVSVQKAAEHFTQFQGNLIVLIFFMSRRKI